MQQQTLIPPLSLGPLRKKAPVSPRALVKRVNRRLKPEGAVLKATRGNSRARACGDLGAYYVVDTRTGFVRSRDVNLEAFSRELGALQNFEVQL